MRGRLNLFQRTMLRWRELYPYNAVHVAWVDVPLDRDALKAAIGAQLAAWGLTRLELGAAARHFDYRGGPAAPQVAVLPESGDAELALDAEIERQLNTPFPAAPVRDPFRYFAVPAAGGFHLGVAYDHFVAGGDSIADLLAAIVARYRGTPITETAPPLYPPTYRNHFARHPLQLLRALAQLPRLFVDAKRALRPRYANPDDRYNHYTHFRLTPQESAALRSRLNALDVSLNDLLIAVLLRTLGAATPERRTAPRRREIAISSIVNIRRDFGAAARRAFGQFLSVLRVTHPVPDGIELGVLAREVHAVTEGIKRERRHLPAILALAIAGLYWPFLADRHRKRFFGKHTPALGGVTTLHVDRPWPHAAAGPPRAYLRGVSTGPVTAVVLAVSTAGGALSVGMSCRRSIFDRSALSSVKTQLRNLAAELPS